MDLYAITYRLKPLKCNWATSFIRLITSIVVSQNLRGLEAFGYKWLYLETVYWLSIMIVWILSKIIAHRITVGMSPRWVSMECQRFCLIVSAMKGLHSHIDPKRSYWPALDVNRQSACLLPHPRNECQQSITEFWSCILDDHWVVRQHKAIIIGLAAFMGSKVSDNIATTSSKWVSMKRQWFIVLHLG